MAVDWIEKSLADLIEIKHGFAFQGEFFRDEPPGEILLTPGNFAIGGGFKGDNLKYYDGPVPEEFVLEEGDLLVSMTDLSKNSDTLGYPAFVPAVHQGRRFLHNQRLGKVVPKDKALIDLRFLHYLMCSREYRHEVVASATGTTVKHTSPERIRRFRFRLPPPPEQRAIAYILGTLDDKIELNRRISEKLEAIARAIFKSWFVDFDPVRSKAERRDPGLPKRIAELFPDDLVGSELGDVPDGWEIERFGELTAVLLGGTPRTAVDEYWNGGVPWAAARDLTQAHSPFVLRTERTISEDGIENSNAKLLPQWTTVVTARGTVGVIRLLGRPMAIIQTSYALLPRSQAGPLYIFFCLHALLDEIRQRTYGTVFDTITTRTLADLHIVRPPSALMDAFEAVAMPFMARLLGAALESEVIASLRDSLLPKLISGELRVSDPDRLLGEVV